MRDLSNSNRFQICSQSMDLATPQMPNRQLASPIYLRDQIHPTLSWNRTLSLARGKMMIDLIQPITRIGKALEIESSELSE
jgi:hypothetical protein